MIDNATLLIAIAFSSAALMLALLLGWLNARRETYLAFGSSGIGFVVIAMVMLGLRNGQLGTHEHDGFRAGIEPDRALVARQHPTFAFLPQTKVIATVTWLETFSLVFMVPKV